LANVSVIELAESNIELAAPPEHSNQQTDSQGNRTTIYARTERTAGWVKLHVSATLTSDAEKIVSAADSAGEGRPQAVKTKDNTPNAKNRRVEVHFHPEAGFAGPDVPTLKGSDKPPDDSKYDPAATPIEDFGKHRKIPGIMDFPPKIDTPDPTKLNPDIWKQIPPIPKGMEPKSPLDVIKEKVTNPVADAVSKTLGLSKSKRDALRDLLGDAVKKGVTTGVRSASEGMGLKDPQGLNAVEKAVEAGIQMKEKPNP